jgi:hypothetical protein
MRANAISRPPTEPGPARISSQVKDSPFDSVRRSQTPQTAMEFPDTEEVTGSNPVRPTPFFENPSSAGSQKGSEAPAGLLHRCWSEHHTLQPELGDCLRLGVLSGDRRDAAVIIPTRSSVAAGECLSALHGASRRSGPVAVVAGPKPRRASRTPGSGLVVMTRGFGVSGRRSGNGRR